ncbi:MAG: Crp/Fnr family transcriptional regulator [Bacteroidota bacterium]
MLRFLPYLSILTSDDITAAEGYFKATTCKKDEIIVKYGHICRHLYFIQQGLVYAQTSDETIIYYEFEGKSFTDIESFIQGTPSQISVISAEENTLIYTVSHADLHQLFKQSHNWALWGIKFWEMELVRVAGYYEAMRNKDASKRYHDLIAENPQILQRIPLGHIASYLGISQVSLSRIRAGIQKK